MNDLALDFLVFVLVLGISIGIGMNLVVPVLKDSKELYYSEIYDKTVDKLEGDKTINTDDGCSSINEIVLEVMGQTYYMPDPGRLNIAGTEISVSNNIAFSPNSANIGTDTKVATTDWYNQFQSNTASKFIGKPASIELARFRVAFDMNNADITTDDTYALFIRLKKDSSSGYELYKCISGGRVQSKGGVII